MLRRIHELSVPPTDDPQQPSDPMVAAAERVFNKPASEMSGLERNLAGIMVALLDPIGTIKRWLDESKDEDEGEKYHPWEVHAGLEVTADTASAKEAAEEASETAQVALGQNPAALPVAGVQLSEDSFMTEDGTTVYTAQFQVEDSDAVIDVITEIDEAAETVHRIKIVTEGDGTQVIDEYFGDLQGNGKHTTLTIDAEGNA